MVKSQYRIHLSIKPFEGAQQQNRARAIAENEQDLSLDALFKGALLRLEARKPVLGSETTVTEGRAARPDANGGLGAGVAAASAVGLGFGAERWSIWHPRGSRRAHLLFR